MQNCRLRRWNSNTELAWPNFENIGSSDVTKVPINSTIELNLYKCTSTTLTKTLSIRYMSE